jgi:tetratricopeptide (TPR) repeat protein
MLVWPIIVYIIGVGIFQRPLNDAMLCLTPFSWRFGRPNNTLTPQMLVVVLTLYLYYPLLAVLSLAANKLCGHKGSKLKYQSVLKIVVLAALCFSSVYFSSFRRRKDICTLVYFYRHHQWKQLLEYASTIPVNHRNKMHTYLINRALYEAGGLLDQMFSRSPQRPGAPMFILKRLNTVRQNLLTCDLFLKLGHVNLAEKKAYEALGKLKESPMAMENLVNIYLAKGETENARMILNVLSKDLLYHKRSKHLLKLIEEDRISSIKEISKIRLVMSTIDGHASQNQTQIMLLNLLESNPGNRRALEYLTADYLTRGDLKSAVDNIGRFRDIGYARLPRHLQEAVLLYEQVYREKPDTKGYDINPEVRRRFNKFKQFSRSMNKTTARPKLLPIFGDTYYFYYIFSKQR